MLTSSTTNVFDLRKQRHKTDKMALYMTQGIYTMEIHPESPTNLTKAICFSV